MGLLAELANARVTIGWQTRIPPAWTFDLDAIGAAANELGIAWPIQVGCANYANGRWSGMHSCEHDRAPHIVRVGRLLGTHDASRTIWHELKHAEQAERLGVETYDREYARYGRKGPGYRSNPFEHEARECEARATAHPLVRSATC